jgi:hypothetical protein
LGLEPDATPTEVKRKYRQLVKAVHPDKSPAPDAGRHFMRVQEAYEFISTTAEEQEQTREGMAREYRDRAASEARARDAREWTERETRQKQERARAEKEAREREDREKRAREAKEKAAKEAEAQRKWERQRDEAATGLGCRRVIITWFACSIVFGLLIIPTMSNFWHSVGLLFPLLLLVLTVDNELIINYQLRKFDRTHPPPTSDAWEPQHSTAADGIWAVIRCFFIILLYIFLPPALGVVLLSILALIAVFHLLKEVFHLLCEFDEKGVGEHQLRKFDKNYPRPSEGTT